MKNPLNSIIRKNSRKKSNEDQHDHPESQLSALNGYSMSGIHVLEYLHKIALDIVDRKIPGDFVECGVCNGGSAGAISIALNKTNKHIWLYDSFEGMPDVKEVDGEKARDYIGLCVGSIDMVIESMNIAKVKEDSYTIRKGWFNETFNLPKAQEICILHIDCDWYDSVLHTLQTFYDKVADGGVIVLDDFGHWEGCREAVYDFFQQHNIKPLIERFGHSQMFWVKNRQHNRDFLNEQRNSFTKTFHS